MTEEWRPFPGEEGYFVSSLGRIRGPRTILRVRFNRPTGYLCKTIRGRTWPVHRAVALAFLGPRPPGHHIDHINRDRTNNAVANLRYCPPDENHANPKVGEANGRASLTEEQAAEILALDRPTGRGWAVRGHPNNMTALAARYGVGKSTISELIAGRTWKHLHGAQPISPSGSLASPTHESASQTVKEGCALPAGGCFCWDHSIEFHRRCVNWRVEGSQTSSPPSAEGGAIAEATELKDRVEELVEAAREAEWALKASVQSFPDIEHRLSRAISSFDTTAGRG